MKTRFYLWPLLALLALLALSCGKSAIPEMPESQVVQEPESQVITPWVLMEGEELEGINTPNIVIAGNDVTKSHLVSGGTDKYDVEWTSGDRFDLIAWADNAYYRLKYTYSTPVNEGDAEFSSTQQYGDGITDFHAIYPGTAIKNVGHFTDDQNVRHRAFGIVIPATQDATPGSVAEGANLSYAQPADMDQKIGFRNMVSIVKFRLSGSIVSQVKDVSLRGSAVLAGNFVFIAPTGVPEFLPDVHFSGNESQVRTVSLTGDFQENTDYFIAFAPSAQSSFSMVFSNADGTKKTTLFSQGTMTLTFERSEIYDFGTIALGDSFSDNNASAFQMIKSASVDGAKAVTIAVIPEGFTEAEMDNYISSAVAGINTMFNTEPYKSYAEYFNVYLLKVASNESGASVTDGHNNITTPVDCYFDSRWGDGYADMMADADKVFSFVEATCPDIKDGTHSIEEVPVLMIINDTRYGGIAHSYSNGQTYCMVPTSYGGGNITWGYPRKKARTDDVIENPSLAADLIETTQGELEEVVGQHVGTWMNTLVHEFGGHSFGRLGDEYWYNNHMEDLVTTIPYTNWPVPFNLNIAASPASTPWEIMLEEGEGGVRQVKSSLVSANPNYARIGIFQGADVSPFNRWRSEKISCMIDNRPYFSTWQRFLIVQRIRKLAGVIPDGETEAEAFALFLTKDKCSDPLRDQASSSVKGVSHIFPPHEVPLLPPPVMHEN